MGDAAGTHQMEATLDKSNLHSRGSQALVSEVSELRSLEQSRKEWEQVKLRGTLGASLVQAGVLLLLPRAGPLDSMTVSQAKD